MMLVGAALGMSRTNGPGVMVPFTRLRSSLSSDESGPTARTVLDGIWLGSTRLVTAATLLMVKAPVALIRTWKVPATRATVPAEMLAALWKVTVPPDWVQVKPPAPAQLR